MKDRVFTGEDVSDALAVAAASLGLTEAELRYVVLDPGSEGGRGLQPTKARVAVMLESTRPSTKATEVAAPAMEGRAGIRSVVRAVAEAAGIDVWAEVTEEEEKVVAHLRGPDHEFFLGRDGRGEVLRATEHLLQRMFGAEFLPRPLRVECDGFQERRDAALADQARDLARGVLEDGQPRTTEPLNAYERRVVHLALNDEAGVTTFSVGQGAARRVTVAPAEVASPAGEGSGDGSEG